MATSQPSPAHGDAPERPVSNLRTALVLALIAAVFFCGVIANRFLFG